MHKHDSPPGSPSQTPAHQPAHKPAHQPIDRSIHLGVSRRFSLDEALADAIARASSGGADIQVDFTLHRIFGRHGGITGERTLCVEIRQDGEVEKDLPEQPPQAPFAGSLHFVEPTVHSLELSGLRTHPPQFVLRGRRTLPTPGWTMHVDAVEVDAQARQIAVRLTDMPPEGPGVQMTGETPLTVQLGELRTGRYAIQLHSRRSPSEPYQLLQAVVIEAV